MTRTQDARAREWASIRSLFDALVDLAPPERAAKISSSTVAEGLLREVRALLAASDAAGDFLETSCTLSLEPADPLEIPVFRSLAHGAMVGSFRIEGLIGRGGHGEVYKAARADGQFEQTVALKLLRPEAAAQFARFKAERQILAGLEHPGIARLIDGGTALDGRPYIAMEFVEGIEIAAHCDAHRLGLEARLALFRTVCDAVAHAHRHAVIHRDLKPENVLVTADSRIKLLDFGIARLVSEGEDDMLTEAILTPDYAAPEQFEGRLPTTGTDVYALGALLFRLVTGQSPWPRGTATAILRLVEDPPRSSKILARMAAPPLPVQKVAGDIDAILAKAMRHDPEARYESVIALSDDVGRHLALRPVRARDGQTGYRLRRFARRNRGRLVATSLLAVTFFAGVVGIAWQARKTEIAHATAQAEADRGAAVRDYVMLMLRTAGGNSGPGAATAKQVLDATAAELARETTNAMPQRALLRTLGDLYVEMDDFAAAGPLLDRYVMLSRHAGDAEGLAQAQQSLAVVAIRRGDLAGARTDLDAAGRFWATDPSRYARERAEANGIEAGLQREAGHPDDAIVLLRKAIARSASLLGTGSEAVATLQHNLGVHALEAGRLQEADVALAEAWNMLVAQGRTSSVIGIAVMGHRAGLAYRQGDAAGAEKAWREAISLRRKLYGPSTALAALQLNLGRIVLASGNAADALPILDEALTTAIAFAGNTSSITLVLRQSRALALGLLGRIPEATTEADRALADAKTTGPTSVYRALGFSVRGQLGILRGDFVGAEADLNAADSIVDGLGAAGAPQKSELALIRGQLQQAKAAAQPAP